MFRLMLQEWCADCAATAEAAAACALIRVQTLIDVEVRDMKVQLIWLL
mgnify:FL=1|jgi:hypothetical protein